jgi:glycosyltransferase involved in cell wall biosynthesis
VKRTVLPTISVVIPAYNAGRLIRETLESVVAQSIRPMEIVVVDDGSTDDTYEAVSQFGEKVSCIRQANGGLASARHAGIAAAKGDLIALMDADDLCEPDRLLVQAAYMVEFPDVALCATGFSAFDENGTMSDSFASSYYGTIGGSPNGLDDIYPVREAFRVALEMPLSKEEYRSMTTYRGNVYERLALGNFLHPPTLMVRRELVRQEGNYDLASRSMCDWDWLIRLSRSGQVGYIDAPLLRYRVSDTQLSSERYRARRYADTLQVIQRTISRDPDIYLRHKRQFDQKIGSYYADCADAASTEDGYAALKWLLKSILQYRYLSKGQIRVLVKALMPIWMIGWVRDVRGRVT